MTTEEQVLNMILSSEPKDFTYDDTTGVFFHKSDIALRIIFDRGDGAEEDFYEPWVARFPDPHGTRQSVYIYYGETMVLHVPCVYVDGGRHVIPYPRSSTNLTLTPFRYHVGRILNHHIPGYGFDFALKRAGIKVSDKDA